MSELKFSDWRTAPRFKILHCLRAPVGGLFRHVADLAMAQASLGHAVGIVCAASGDALTEARLLALAPNLRLGLHRLPMGRELGMGDVRAWRLVTALARELEITIIHGHGAKGGAYARLAARALKKTQPDLRCFYTPHGGVLHYPPSSLAGQVYGQLERQLEAWTDGIVFESRFAADRYMAYIGAPQCASKVVANGVTEAEFQPVRCAADAADFIFVGELRMLKGVDVALEALAMVRRVHHARAVFVGDGPDAARFKEMARSLGVADAATFPGTMRAREGFALGRTLLVPSRAESLPYIVLEAIAAGLPVIATRVGGIPEIIPESIAPLVPPGDAAALARAMTAALEHRAVNLAQAAALRLRIRDTFTVAAMSEAVTGFYDADIRTRIAA